MGLSTLGIFHTLIGVIAIVAALVSFVYFGKINLKARSGQVYFYTTIVASLTSLPISKEGGFGPGHAIAILILVLIAVAYWLNLKKPGNNKVRYFENFCMSFSFFLSMIPTINESLTRLPVSQPIAADSKDPLILNLILGAFVVFVVGSVYQIWKQKRINAGESQ